MPDLQTRETRQLAFIPTLEEAITRIVEHHAGIRDSALSIFVLVETADHPELKSQKDGTYAASMIAWTVHRMVTTGQLIAIDCETPAFSYTYLLPRDALVTITTPASPCATAPESQTRH